MKTTITYSDIYIPKTCSSIDEYVKNLDVSHLHDDITQEDIANMLKYSMGIEKVYLEDRTKEADIFSDLLERYFSQGETKPDEIDFIVYTRGDSVAVGDPWSLSEGEVINVPYFLQHRFKIKNAQIFNIEQECSGTLMALRLAFSLVNDGSSQKILILSRNFFETPEKRLMGGMIVVSDGLGIMEIAGGEAGMALLDYAGKTDGSIARVLDLAKAENSAMVVQTGASLMKSLVEKHSLTMRDVSLIIPQNISRNIWTFYSQTLDFPKERVFLENIKDGGHMGDVDMIRNIDTIRRKDLLAENQYALAYGLGTGTSWNAFLLQAL